MLHDRHYDLIEFFQDLNAGDPMALVFIGAIVAWIAFNIVYKKVTGREFVKPRAERRKARNRRKIVLWEYRRDA